MKLITLFLLFAINLTSIASTDVTSGVLMQAVDGTNLRAYPTLNAKVIRVARKEEVFYRISEGSERGFIKVLTANDEEAWINEKYLFLFGGIPPDVKFSKSERKD